MTRSHKASSPRKRAPAVRPIDPRIDRALDAMAEAVVKGETPLTITAAAKIARLSREGLSKALKRGDVASRADAKVRQMLGGDGLIEAGATAIKSLRSKSEYVAADAAFRILAIAGHKPREDSRPISNGGLSVTVVLRHERGDLTAIRAPSVQQIEAKAQTVEDER